MFYSRYGYFSLNEYDIYIEYVNKTNKITYNLKVNKSK